MARGNTWLSMGITRPFSSWVGCHLWLFKPSRYVASHLDQPSLVVHPLGNEWYMRDDWQ